MTNADKYIQQYKKFEAIVRREFKIDNDKSIVQEFKKPGPYAKYYDDVHYCADVRNLLQHKAKIQDTFAVEPNDVMIQYLEDLTKRIENRKKCSDINIPLQRIYTCTYTSSVKEVMQKMQKNTFTHVPVLENDLVVGVFDENALFTYLADQGIVDLDGITIGDLKPFTSEFDREMEKFLFVERTLYVDELQYMIQTESVAGKRVGAVFVTLNGKQNGKLCGLITPWDLVGL
jgi:CBS domain.